MGAYKLPPREEVMTQTIHGRVIKPARKYHDEQFVKGSGAAARPGYDGTDMEFVGSTSSSRFLNSSKK